MKINILLGGISKKQMPTGGYKVVYQYANKLSKKNNVTIYYTLENGKNERKVNPILWIALKKLYFLFNLKKYPNWFKLNKNVKQKVVTSFDEKNIKNGDVCIATAIKTSEYLNKYSEKKGKKVYFIQDFENWNGISSKEVTDSYNFDMKKIVISNWLKNIVDKYSNSKSIFIPNGIDDSIFYVKNNIENRNNHSICMLFHKDERKNCKMGLEIINKLKENYQDLEVYLFGYPDRPSYLPDWINYIQNANEQEVAKIMNKSAIYMCTSLQEGYGLPGLEAMFCGCALASTKCKGVLEYANNNNSMLCETNDLNEMFNNIVTLMNDNKKRIEIAKKGNIENKNRTLKISSELFEREIEMEK